MPAAIVLAIFLFSVIKYQPLVYAKTYAYPWWGEMLGWLMALASMVMIPAYMLYFLLTTPGTLRQVKHITRSTIAYPSKADEKKWSLLMDAGIRISGKFGWPTEVRACMKLCYDGCEK
uniref:Putative gaba transporter ixodes scapularis gaba transporter n=1 Tax=Amblyomma triste TaxID=251400 RepID=A0A023G0M0_AMBTT